MSILDMSTASAALKELYASKIKNLAMSKRPLLALLEKKVPTSIAAGKYVNQPVIYSANRGSANFANAVANATAPDMSAFLLPMVADYATAEISGQAMAASRSDKGAFLEMSELAIDSAINGLADSLAGAIYRGGYGTVGTISSIHATSGAITLTLAGDHANLEKGSVLVALTGGETGAVRNDGTNPYVAKVVSINRSAGTLVIGTTGTTGAAGVGTSVATGTTGWAAGDVLAIQGNTQAVTEGSASTRKVKVTGLAGWLPSTAPSSGESFFGVDRSVDSRLFGSYVDGSGLGIEEALIELSIRVDEQGGAPDYCFMHTRAFGKLVKELGSSVQRTKVGNAEIGFEGITLHTATGPVTVLPDKFCPQNRAFLLQMDSWRLWSAFEEIPMIDDTDGNILLRTSGDSVQARVKYYAQLGTDAPGHNGSALLGV